MDNNAQVGTLEALTTTLLDSVNGFEDAAKNSDNQRLREQFIEFAQERRRVAEDLRSTIRNLGGDPPEDGSIMGKTHQTWHDLKAAVTGRDDQRIVNSVEAGEDYLKEKFETALNSGELDGETRSVVERADQSVRQGHDRVSQMKHQMDAIG